MRIVCRRKTITLCALCRCNTITLCAFCAGATQSHYAHCMQVQHNHIMRIICRCTTSCTFYACATQTQYAHCMQAQRNYIMRIVCRFNTITLCALYVGRYTIKCMTTDAHCVLALHSNNQMHATHSHVVTNTSQTWRGHVYSLGAVGRGSGSVGRQK
jgi:hypothetical protein